MILIFPMSGQGVRYQKAGYSDPKPMILVGGRPMIDRVLACFPESWPCIMVYAENHLSTGLPHFLKEKRPSALQLTVSPHQEGPIKAIEKALEHIGEDQPVLISYCDYGMKWDAGAFQNFVEQTRCDACLISYRGFHAHYLNPQTYAYSRLDGERVVEVQEKASFTDNRENEYASAGGYYFKSSKKLQQALQFQRKHNLQVNGEFYTSLTVQALLAMDPSSHVRVFEVDAFFQWGTPQDLRRFEYWEKTFKAFNDCQWQERLTCEQVLMPMAGKGSRLSQEGKPKPFLTIIDRPMFQRALSSLPQGNRTVLVGLKEHEEFLSTVSPVGAPYHLKLLAKTPPGQAFSTQEGLDQLTPELPVIVSSCDHEIVMDPSRLEQFFRSPQCDLAFFSIRGFPGADERPQSFAYIQTRNTNEEFPLIENISVKQPISNRPSQDPLFVGTFWFKNPELMKTLINSLIDKNIRINNEIYLDSIFEVAKSIGYTARMIPMDGYINWGDPDSMAEAFYWYEVYCGRKISGRTRFPGMK